MQRFMAFYVGPPTPPDAPHEGWPEWFARLGDQLVDKGSPLANGLALRDDGSTGSSTTRINGYSIVRAEDRDDVLAQLKDHPYLTLGRDHYIEVHLLP